METYETYENILKDKNPYIVTLKPFHKWTQSNALDATWREPSNASKSFKAFTGKHASAARPRGLVRSLKKMKIKSELKLKWNSQMPGYSIFKHLQARTTCPLHALSLSPSAVQPTRPSLKSNAGTRLCLWIPLIYCWESKRDTRCEGSRLTSEGSK